MRNFDILSGLRGMVAGGERGDDGFNIFNMFKFDS